VTLAKVVRVTVLMNLFMLGSELFTEFYTGGSHTDAAARTCSSVHGHSTPRPVDLDRGHAQRRRLP
jgi:hypothetical protein